MFINLSRGPSFTSLPSPKSDSPTSATLALSLTASGVIEGEYNRNGVVDVADFVVWRKTDGTPVGYDSWRAHFGETAAVVRPPAALFLNPVPPCWCCWQLPGNALSYDSQYSLAYETGQQNTVMTVPRATNTPVPSSAIEPSQNSSRRRSMARLRRPGTYLCAPFDTWPVVRPQNLVVKPTNLTLAPSAVRSNRRWSVTKLLFCAVTTGRRTILFGEIGSAITSFDVNLSSELPVVRRNAKRWKP